MPSSAQDMMRVRAERAKRMLGDDDTATISINNYGVYGACRETLEYDWFADIVDPEVTMAMDCLEEATVSRELDLPILIGSLWWAVVAICVLCWRR